MTDIEPPLQTQSNSNNKWDSVAPPSSGGPPSAPPLDDDYDGGNSTARLFERTRIQVLAG